MASFSRTLVSSLRASSLAFWGFDRDAKAIISGSKGRAEDKLAAMEAAGITVVKALGEFGATVAAKLGKS